MNIKTTTITGAIIVALGLTGTFATDTGQKLIKCTGRAIQYEQEVDKISCSATGVCFKDGTTINYYCATEGQMASDWTREEKKFKENKTKKEDYVFLDLVVKNDKAKRKALENDLLLKYNPKTKMFNGGLMGSDFNYQLQFAGILANLACGGNCKLIGDTMDEKIYNILSKK